MQKRMVSMSQMLSGEQQFYFQFTIMTIIVRAENKVYVNVPIEAHKRNNTRQAKELSSSGIVFNSSQNIIEDDKATTGPGAKAKESLN